MELNALCTVRRQLTRQLDRRAALICLVVAQAGGNKDAEIDDFMPKTEAELSAERQARFLAWVDKHRALTKAAEGQQHA